MTPADARQPLLVLLNTRRQLENELDTSLAASVINRLGLRAIRLFPGVASVGGVLQIGQRVHSATTGLTRGGWSPFRRLGWANDLLLTHYKISYRLVTLFHRLGRRLRGKQSVADGGALAITLE